MATKAKKTATQTILSALKKASKKGISAADLADRTGINLNTVRFTLSQLVADKDVKIVDTATTGMRGRPANLYTI